MALGGGLADLGGHAVEGDRDGGGVLADEAAAVEGGERVGRDVASAAGGVDEAAVAQRRARVRGAEAVIDGEDAGAGDVLEPVDEGDGVVAAGDGAVGSDDGADTVGGDDVDGAHGDVG